MKLRDGADGKALTKPMQYALNRKGERIQPKKGARARCPACGEKVLAKCGKIMVHHWAHEAGADCDCWFEPETEWHRSWKAAFPKEWTEVPLGEHRADVFFLTEASLNSSTARSHRTILRRARRFTDGKWFDSLTALSSQAASSSWKGIVRSGSSNSVGSFVPEAGL